MPRLNVSPQFNKWALGPADLLVSGAVHFPQVAISNGLRYYHTGYGGSQLPTTFPAATSIFAPHHILKPSKDTVDIQAFIWWGVDLGLLTTPVATQTNVMFGATRCTLCDQGPVFSDLLSMPFYTNFVGTGISDVYQDSTGIVPPARVDAALADTIAPKTISSTNTVTSRQAFANMIVPQCAISMHTFNPGDTLCGLYRDPLQFIYKDTNGTVKNDNTVSFKKFTSSTNGVKVAAGTGSDLILTETGLQSAGNQIQIWRLNAGLPATGYMANGFDANNDNVKEVDNYAAPVTLFGIELFIQ